VMVTHSRSPWMSMASWRALMRWEAFMVGLLVAETGWRYGV
jgi:hypothetical protein